MIEVIAKYPWGEKPIFYDSWEYVIIYYSKNYKNEWEEETKLRKVARTREEYEGILKNFNEQKFNCSKDIKLHYTEYNSCYAESYTPKYKATFYLQGFLNNNQN